MIDLNTLLAQALTKALDDALQPILARIATIESRAPSVDLDELIDDRIGNFLDNDDLASRIDVEHLEGLENAIQSTLDGMDLADTVRPVVEELLTNASITLG